MREGRRKKDKGKAGWKGGDLLPCSVASRTFELRQGFGGWGALYPNANCYQNFGEVNDSGDSVDRVDIGDIRGVRHSA